MRGPTALNAALVSFYGAGKPPSFLRLIADAQAALSDILGAAFAPYAAAQVHATLIGLEGVRVGGQILNANYLRARAQDTPMDLAMMLRLLKDERLLPLHLRVAGYKERATYPFTSRGLHPYLRSFSLQGEIAVAMGWPFAAGGSPMALDELRRRFNDAGVLHKYHARPDDVDNDFFFVLGRVNRAEVAADRIPVAEARVREVLAAREPVEVALGRDELCVAVYSDPTLPLESTRVYSLDQAEARLDGWLRVRSEEAP